MKIIHTGDWHLGHRLYNYDNTEEEDHFLLLLADLVAKEQPDALVVCGDVFDTGAPGNDVARRFTDRLLEIQSRCPEMVTVVIAGNHDSYSRLVVDEALWRRCRVHVFGVPAEDESGLADFAKNIVEIPGKGVIAAVPFCHPRNFPSVAGVAGENRDANYFEGLAKYVADHSERLPAVLVAHLAVKGDIDLRGHDRTLIVGGEECVGLSKLGLSYDYIALGHIHCPQWIKGERKVARYCGTPRAIRFDETYNHGVDVVTVEVGKEPAVRTEVFEPLHALSTIGGEKGAPFDEALRLLDEAKLEPGTYIRLNVRLGVGEMPGPDWTERARKACSAKGLRFCVNNPIREASSECRSVRATLTMEELKSLSEDDVLRILTTRHELSTRQRELVKALMEETFT